MLKLFRSNSPFSVLALLIITIIFKLFWLIHPEPAVLLAGQEVWKGFLNLLEFFLGKNAFILTFFAVLNLFGQAVFFNHIINKVHLFSNKNYLPALCFITLSSFLPQWDYLSAPLIGNWFLLIAINGMLQFQNHSENRKQIFNVGFCIACAGLLSPVYLIFLLLLYVSLSISRSFKTGEWIMGMVGFLTPFYFLVAILFLIYGWAIPWTDWLPTQPTILNNLPVATIKSYLIIGFLILLLILGLINVNAYSEHMLKQVKKNWSICVAGFFIALLPPVIENIGGYPAMLPMLFFLGLIAATIWFKEKRIWSRRILFYLFLLVLIFASWIKLP